MRGNLVYVKDEATVTAGHIPRPDLRQWMWRPGISNDDYVQITSGLSEGDEVYVIPRPAIPKTDMFQMGGMGGPDGGMGRRPLAAGKWRTGRKRRQPWRWKWRKPRGGGGMP